MGKRNAKNKIKLSYLNDINYIDKRIKIAYRKDNTEEISKLRKKRELIRNKLKTKK